MVRNSRGLLAVALLAQWGDDRELVFGDVLVRVDGSRRLTGKLWLNAGVGMTVFNSLEYKDPDGDNTIIDENMSVGFFRQIGLSLKTW